MESSIYKEKITKILSKGEGIKVALFDCRAKSILNSLVPHSLFLENNYFLFDMIDSQRTKMGKVTCSVFIESFSVHLLIKELKSPNYENYFVYFLNSINENELSAIAEADRCSVVREIYEVNINIYQLDTNLFTFHSKFEENLPNESINYCLESVERICGFLKTLGLNPQIQTHKNTLELAKRVRDSMEGFSGRESKMLFLDRSIDMVTPLIYEWRYQPMIYEYLEYQSGIVKVANSVFSLFNDTFFEENKFLEISRVSESLNSYISKAHRKKSSLPFSFEENTQIMETHLNIHNFIIKECVKNASISNKEYECINRNYKACEEFLKNGEFPFLKRAKLFLVYLHSINYNFLLEKEEMLKSKHFSLYPEFINIVDNYSRYFRKWGGKSYEAKFDADLDLKLGYKPPISRLAARFIGGRLKKDFEFLDKKFPESKNLVLFLKGGITYSEYRSIQTVSKNVNFYIISDYIIGYKDIMNLVIKQKSI